MKKLPKVPSFMFDFMLRSVIRITSNRNTVVRRITTAFRRGHGSSGSF